MRPIIFILCLMASSLYAETYQVITSEESSLNKVLTVGRTVVNRGRLHVVELFDGVKFDRLDSEITKSLRPIDLKSARSYRYRATRGHSFDAEIDAVVQKISAERMKRDLEHLVTFNHRRVGSEGNKRARAWIFERFKQLGLDVSEQCFLTGGWANRKGCNVVAKRAGTDPTAKEIVVVAHYDDVGKINAGADDNGSGIVALFEMAHVLKKLPLRKTITFVAVDAEEIGLYGSKNYVKVLQKQGRLKNLGLALVMDVIGYNTNDLFIIETKKRHEQAANDLAELASVYSNLEVEINLHPWGSDHIPFLDKGVETLFTSQDWSNHNPCYHKSCDTIEKVDFRYIREITKVNVARILSR